EDAHRGEKEWQERYQKFLARPFADYPPNPGMPREQLLRGQFREANQELVRTRTRVRDQRARFAANPALLREAVGKWWDDVLEASGRFELARAEAEKAGV